MFKRLTVFTALLLLAPSLAYAINDVQVVDLTNFDLLTADTLAATTVTASAGGQVTNIDVESNYIDLTVDNLTNITFNTTAPGNYIRVSRKSGSYDYTVSPPCPTSTATIAGTGAQAILTLEVFTTNACAAGIAITQSGGSTNVAEGGATDTYTVVLLTAPAADVTVTITPDSQVSVSPATLTFTPLNWNISQTVTVTAVDDAVVEGPHTGTISHGATSTDPLYNGIGAPDVTVNITDNDFNYGGGGGGGGGGWRQPSAGETITPSTPASTQEITACGRTSQTPVPFTDTADHWAKSYIETLYRRCVIDGRTSSLFVPNDNVSRAEIVKIILNTYNIPTVPWQDLYPDVLQEDWFAQYVTKASRLGIVQGYIQPNGTSLFKPNQPVTRAEALKIALKTKGVTSFSGYTSTFADVQQGSWYYDYVAYAQAKGIIEGYKQTYGHDGLVKDFYSFPRDLEMGDTGEDVKSLKEIMTQLAYFNGNIDTTFDQPLKDALIKYQTSNNIPTTGNMGPLTLNAILQETLQPITINLFKPDTYITRGEISKIDLMVEQAA